MAFTVGDVLMAARDLNPALTPTRHPDAVGRRFLTRYVKSLVSRIVELRPGALATTVTSTTLPLVTFDAGVTIPADLLLVQVTARPERRTDDSARVVVELVPAGVRYDRGTRGPKATRDGQTLTLAGSADDWVGFDRLDVRTVAMPADLATNATTVPLPDDALDTCATNLGAFFALRHVGPDTKGFDASALVAAAGQAEQTFLSRLTNQMRAEVWSMRRVRD